MATLYAVTASEYSDYHIVTICSSKERAEEICNMHNFNKDEDDWGRARVEEYEDGIEADLSLNCYQITLELNGNLRSLEQRYGEDKIYEMFKGYTTSVIKYDRTYLTVVFTNDETTAIKIARDRLAEEKAKRANIT